MNISRCIAVLSCALIMSSCAATPEVIQPQPKKQAKVALVLGAGAARGFAHIGVIKVLESNGIPVHIVVGTSAGSLVGSMYASGMDPYQMQKLALDIKKGDIADLAIPDNGFIKGDLLEKFVNKTVKNAPMEKLQKPFFAVATEMPGGREVVFGQGNTGTAVRASCSVPGVFRPVTINGGMYVDGGVVSPVAVDAARRQGADVVIAVDISSDLDTSKPETTIETILQSVNIMYAKISAGQLERADVVIRPMVGKIGSGDFERRHDAILEGEKATMKALPRIREVIEKLREEGRL